ncbi:MAG: pyrroloquinoline quinone precursor peptide PqqA [Pleurocapsa sp. CRU_1_2]|nr:pyrroloquinoline quinone precursor peptide PqqA [Pleurocapsa sp. CRU_1_2]
MVNRAKDYLGSSKKEKVSANSNKGKNTTDTALSTTGKPLAVWESPEFEEFDLCMEVTAYVHQWQ